MSDETLNINTDTLEKELNKFCSNLEFSTVIDMNLETGSNISADTLKNIDYREKTLYRARDKFEKYSFPEKCSNRVINTDDTLCKHSLKENKNVSKDSLSPLPSQRIDNISTSLSRYRRHKISLSNGSNSIRSESANYTKNQVFGVNRALSQNNARSKSNIIGKTFNQVQKAKYTSRIPTQILISNLINQLDRELDPTEFSDKWIQFKNIKIVLDQLSSAQSDSTFPPAPLNKVQFLRRFDNLIIWMEKTHSQRLKQESNERSKRKHNEANLPIDLLTGDMRRMAIKGTPLSSIPPHEYPEELLLYNVKPIYTETKGWGLQAVEDVKIHSLVLQIPLHLMLVSSTTQFHPKLAEVMAGNEVFYQHNALVRLALLLLVEMLEGYSTPYQSYISLLPPNSSSPLNYSISDLEPFRKSLTMIEIFEHSRFVARLYLTIYRTLGLTTFINRGNFTWAAFQWAYSIVLSRSFEIPLPSPSLLGENSRSVQEYGLVPLGDLVNFDHEGITPFYNPETACLELIAPDNINTGSELFIRWPILNNRDLLLRYGFCADRTLKDDNLRIHLAIPCSNHDSDSLDRFTLCQSIRLPCSNTFSLQLSPITKTSRELLQFILIMTLEIEVLRKLFGQVPLLTVPGRAYLHDRSHIFRLLDKELGDASSEPSTALKTALNWLRVTLQVHLRVSLRSHDLDDQLISLDPNDKTSYPLRWIIAAIRHEQRFIRTAIDEYDTLLGTKSILED